MNIVKVKVGIDIDNPKQMEVLNTFLLDLRSLKGEKVQMTGKIAETVKTEPIKTETPKTEAKTETINEQAKTGTPAAINPGGAKGIEYIRKLIGLRSGAHRDEMRAKLIELGGTSATDLPVDKYQEMIDFLEALSD